MSKDFRFFDRRHIQEIIKKYGGLWFNNEMIVIEHQE